MASSESMWKLLLTVFRLGKWLLFILAAFSYLLLDTEYQAQVDENDGFKDPLPGSERANAKNSRLAMHNANHGRVIPAKFDDTGQTPLHSAPIKGTIGNHSDPKIYYFKDPRIGINPYGFLPSIIVGGANEIDDISATTVYAMSDKDLSDTFDETTIGGVLRLDCDNDYLIDKDDHGSLNKFFQYTGVVTSVADINAGDLATACGTGSSNKGPVCVSTRTYEDHVDALVDPQLDAKGGSDKAAPLPNRHCAKIPVLVNLGDSQDGSAETGQAAVAIASNYKKMCALEDLQYDNKSRCEVHSVDPEDGRTVEEQMVENLCTVVTTVFQNDVDKRKIIRSFFSQVLSTTFLASGEYSKVNLLGQRGNQTLGSLKMFAEEMIDNECAPITCGDYQMSAFNLSTPSPSGTGSGSIAKNCNAQIKSICTATFNMLDRNDIDYRGAFKKAEADSTQTPFFTGDVAAAVAADGLSNSSEIEKLAKATTTDIFHNVPPRTQETKTICEEFQSGQDAEFGLIITALIFMFAGLSLILASIAKNVYPVRMNGLDEMVTTYHSAKLSVAARACNILGYLILLLGFIVSSHYSHKGESLSVYVNTIIYGDMGSVSNGLNIETSQVMPNQPINFGSDSGYSGDVEDGNPSYPYNRGTANMLLYVAIALFVMDIVGVFVVPRVFGKNGEAGELSSSDRLTLMSRLTTSIL